MVLLLACIKYWPHICGMQFGFIQFNLRKYHERFSDSDKLIGLHFILNLMYFSIFYISILKPDESSNSQKENISICIITFNFDQNKQETRKKI